jgi:lysophospholipase L1-like esterase
MYSLLVVIVAVGLLEAGARLYYAVRGGAGSSVDLHAYWVDDPSSGYALRPGYDANGIRVNRLGFRGPEFDTQRGPGQRMVALGDSTTFGPREQECAYPYLLPDLLRPRQVEVINAGIEGYRSDRALAHLERRVLPLQPDLVTVLIGWNDLYQTDPRAESANLALQANPLQRVLSWSAVAQSARRLYFERLQPHSATTTSVNAATLANYRPAGYENRLRRILQTIRGAGAEALVFTWPTVLDAPDSAVAPLQYPYHTRTLSELQALYADYQAVVRQIATDEGVAVIDVAAAFSPTNKRSLFTDTIHFTCEGHALFAQAAAPAIADRLSAHALAR